MINISTHASYAIYCRSLNTYLLTTAGKGHWRVLRLCDMVPRSCWAVQDSLREINRLTLEHGRSCAFLKRLLFRFTNWGVGQGVGRVKRARYRIMMILSCAWFFATDSLARQRCWILLVLRKWSYFCIIPSWINGRLLRRRILLHKFLEGMNVLQLKLGIPWKLFLAYCSGIYGRIRTVSVLDFALARWWTVWRGSSICKFDVHIWVLLLNI